MTANRQRYELKISPYGANTLSSGSDVYQPGHEQIRRILGQEKYRSFVSAADYETHGAIGIVRTKGRFGTEDLKSLENALDGIATLNVKEIETRNRAALRQERRDAFAALEQRTDEALPSFDQVIRDTCSTPEEEYL